MAAIKKYAAAASIALSLVLLGYFLYPALSSFTGPLTDLPIYVGAPSPYSYIIDTNGTHYFAWNGTTGASTTNADADSLLNSIVAANTDFAFRTGTYVIDSAVLVDGDNVKFHAMKGEAVTLELGANGYFNLCQTTLIDNVMFEGLYFNLNGTATRAITSESMGSGLRTQRLTVRDCTFKNCYAAGCIPIYVMNGELCDVRDNYLGTWQDTVSWSGGAFILFDMNDYHCGNSRVYHNEMNLRVLRSWCVEIRSDGSGKEHNNYELAENHYYSNITTFAAYAVFCNATAGGKIKNVKITGGRTENCGLYDSEGNVEIRVDISGYWQVGDETNTTYPFIKFRWAASNYSTRNSRVHDCLFTVSGDDSVVIDDDNSDATAYNCIENNRFINASGSPMFIAFSARTKLVNNEGHTAGYLATPATTATLRDSGASAILNDTEYSVRNSPKTIYINGGVIINVYRNGEVIFQTTNVTVPLRYGDTFEVEWDTEPTIKVFVEGS